MRVWKAGVCAAALLVARLAGQTSPAQTPPQASQEPTLHIGVTAVEVDAVVTDGSGRHVPDLQASDFELLQDGKPQTITSFRFVPVRTRPAEAAPAGGRNGASRTSNAPAPPAVPLTSSAHLTRDQATRIMAIVVDDLAMSFTNMGRLREGLNTLLDREMQPTDLVSIVTTSHGVGRLQQFTNDWAALKQTAAALSINLLGLGAGSDEGESAKFENDRDALNKGQQIEAAESAQGQMLVGALAAVQNVVRGMRDLPGRKSVILVGDGIALIQPAPAGATIARSDQFVLPRPDVFEAFRQLVDEANRSFVIIHTLTTTGVFNPLADSYSVERRGRSATQSELTFGINQTNAQRHGNRVTRIFAHRKTGGDIFKVLLHLDGAGLTFSEGEDGRSRAPIEVLATLVDARGAAVEGKVFRFALQTPSEPDAATRAAGFVCSVELPAEKPGPYQLRVAARDVTSDRTGTGYQFVRVPNLASTRLALSGIALQGDSPGASPAQRRFHPASTLHYAFAAYNAQLDPKDHRPALTLRLRLYREGSLLVDGKPVPVDATISPDAPERSADVSGDLQLSPAITPGEYQLQIEVKDTHAPLKTSVARQWIDFTIAAP